MRKSKKSETKFSVSLAFIGISEALIWSILFTFVASSASAAYFAQTTSNFQQFNSVSVSVADQVTFADPEALNSLKYVDFSKVDSEAPKVDIKSASIYLSRAKQLTSQKPFNPSPSSKKRKNVR